MHSEALHFQAFLSLHDISQTHKDSLNLNFEKLCEQEIILWEGNSCTNHTFPVDCKPICF